MSKCDFSGWATRNNLRCSDGRVIIKDAFKDNSGKRVPLVWNHLHDDPSNVLGHAVLENRDEGVYAYCTFNDTDNAQNAKLLVEHGDISSLSIHAGRLKQSGSKVLHGAIREVSLVLAGANPGAFIDSVSMQHGDGSEEEEALIYTGEEVSLQHSDVPEVWKDENGEAPQKVAAEPETYNNDISETVSHSDDEKKSEKEEREKSMEADKKVEKPEDEKTVQDVVDTMTDEQKNVMYALVGTAIESYENEESLEDEGGKEMKHNVFETEQETGNYLTHSDEEQIISLAKSNSVGSLQDAINIYAEENDTLQHGIDDIDTLFPDFTDIRPGAPEMITRDQGWISTVMSKIHKSPISRIRTRQADLRSDELRAFGYEKGNKKNLAGNIKLLKRTTDPQTVYRKDALNRDDIIDIQDFDVVAYQYEVMRQNLNEEIATAIMIGDGREDGDDNKIDESHIRPIWKDDELYTIHADVDVEAAKAELQGTGTGVSFGENYIYAEAVIASALYAREKYKGSGAMDFYCDPHLLNVMLLARDMNGRRIYGSKSDLAAALNVEGIYTVEQFAGKTRTTADSKTKKLLGIFVNLADYNAGSTKGGEITRFNQFDIDFNQEKYLIETRLSGALTRVYSAIALEEDVTGTPVAQG